MDYSKQLKRMKKIKLLRQALVLAALSLTISVFLLQNTNSCGRVGYGLPMEFIYSYCDCTHHRFPIDFIGLFVDVVYHFIIGYSIAYLRKDAQETWRMFRGRVPY